MPVVFKKKTTSDIKINVEGDTVIQNTSMNYVILSFCSKYNSRTLVAISV